MPYVADNIRNNLQRPARDSLAERASSLEQELQTPVRVMEVGDDRTVDRMMGTWTGASARMNNFPGFTEQQRDEDGITIMFYTWNAELDNTYYMTRVTEDYWPETLNNEQRRPRVVNNEVELECFTATPEAIANAEGVPLFVNDEDGLNPYGALYGARVLFLGCSAHSIAQWGNPDWDKWLYDPIRVAQNPERRAEMDRARQAKQRQAFTALMRDQGNVAIESLREQLDTDYTEFAEAQETIVNLKASLDQRNRQLSIMLSEGTELTEDQIAAEWAKLENMENIRSFYLGSHHVEQGGVNTMGHFLKFDTEFLWLTHPESGRELPLGEFAVTLDFGLNSTRIHNKTYRPRNTWDHPHVKEGRLCVAEYGPTITTLLRQRKLASMVNMMFRVLSTVTLEDAWGANNLPMWVEYDNGQRETKGWPVWTSDETVHPMLAQENTTEGAA